MIGKIIRAVSGFYYVDTKEHGIYQCRARGIFRNEGIKPLIGDNVDIDITHEGDKEGNVLEILPRKNSLIRPTVANIDHALIVFAADQPAPNLNLLDRFLVLVDEKGIDATVCFNKVDLMSEDEIEKLSSIYQKAGYPVVKVSAGIYPDQARESIKDILTGKTTVFAGPSGVGKSTLINLLQDKKHMETGMVSKKIKRGKHTTRHAELIHMDDLSYVVDTPGFSSLRLTMEAEELKYHFREFQEVADACKFNGCNHLSEPECQVKDLVNSGKISQSRYKNYEQLYEELSNVRRY